MTSTAAASTSVKPSVFVGRQSILDRQRRVFGYELLFRNNPEENFCAARNGDQASCQVINNSMNVMGLRSITAGHKAFVNITRSLLVNDLYTVLPPAESVIELLETVTPDKAVVQSCKRLKDAGYSLALDDFVFRPGYEPLLDLADFVKVDFMGSSMEQRTSVLEVLTGRNASLVAEKVETQEDFAAGLDLGYALFQGFFFCKPEILAGQELQPLKRNYLRFLQQAVQPKLDYAALEQIVKEEPSLSVKLLRYMNSAIFGLRSKVGSIRQALALLGERLLRQWAAIIAMTSLGDDKPAELITLCLIRARFCEQIGPMAQLPGRDMDLFLMGLLSALDALVDRPMSEVLAEIPIAHDIKAALLGSTTVLGTVYGMVLACERGNRRLLALQARQIGVPEEHVWQVYCDAMLWADGILHS